MPFAAQPARSGRFSIRSRWRTLSAYDRTTLFWSLSAGFVLRAIFIFFSILRAPVAVQVDTERYVGIAYAKGFASWFNMNDPAGYPLLLRLTGSDMHFYVGILLLQLAMSVATIYLGWRLGQRYLSPNANRWFAVLLVINPVSIFFSSQLMTECSFTFFFLLSLLWLLEGIEPGGNRWGNWKLLLAGLSLSFAGLIRPTGVVLAGALTIILAFFIYRKRLPWQSAATFLVAAWSLMFIYAMGLKIRYDYFGLSAKGPTMLTYYYTGPVMQSLGYSDSDIDSTMNTLPTMFEYLDGRITGGEFADAHNHFFWEFFKQHPAAYLKVYALGWSQMLLWPGVGLFQLHRHFGIEPRGQMEEMQYNKVFYYVVRGDFRGELRLLTSRLESSSLPVLFMWCVSAILPPLTLILAIAGLLLFARSSKISLRDKVILLGILAAYVFLVPHMAASTRFRMPINPLLALFAVYAVQQFYSQKRSSLKGAV